MASRLRAPSSAARCSACSSTRRSRARRAAGAPELPRSGGLSIVLSKRIIACLDVRDGQVVKGVQFERLRHAGDPAELARPVQRRGDRRGRHPRYHGHDREAAGAGPDRSARRAGDLHSPDRGRRHPVGGGRGRGGRGGRRQGEPQHRGARAIRPCITTLARRYGSQAVIVAIDAKRGGDRFAVYVAQRHARHAARRRRVGARGRRPRRRRDSADLDGPRRHAPGVRLRDDRRRVDGRDDSGHRLGRRRRLDHFVDVFTPGRADAALAASIFHYAETSVSASRRRCATAAFPSAS